MAAEQQLQRDSGERRTRALVLGPLRPPHVSDQVVALAERGFDLHVAGNSPPDHDNSAIDQVGVPITVMPMFKRNTPWGMRSMVRWTAKLIAEVKPDVVQAHWVPGYAFATAAAGFPALATTAWGSDIYRTNRIQDAASRFALKRSLSVMADSRDLLERCIELGADSSRTNVVQWGVDLEMFSPAVGEQRETIKRRLGLGPGPVILSPRSLMPVYNVPDIVEAFDRIADRHSTAQLVVKHMGTASVDLPESSYADRIRLIGRVPYEDMADYYRVADACVSVTSSDSSPRSIWEAMASSAPCVLTDLPWVHELIVPGEHALTVDVGDVEGISEALDSLLSDPQRRAELGAKGRHLVERHLGRNDQMDFLARILRGVADEALGDR